MMGIACFHPTLSKFLALFHKMDDLGSKILHLAKKRTQHLDALRAAVETKTIWKLDLNILMISG